MILFQSLALILLLLLGGLALMLLGSDAVVNPFRGRHSRQLRGRVQLAGVSLSLVGLLLAFYFTCFPNTVWWVPEDQAYHQSSHYLLLGSMVAGIVTACMVLLVRGIGIALVCFCGMLLAQVLTLTLLGASTVSLVLCLGYLGGMIALYFVWNAFARAIPTPQDETSTQAVLVVVSVTLLGAGLIGGSYRVVMQEAEPMDKSAINTRPRNSARELEVADSLQSSSLLVLVLIGGSVATVARFCRLPGTAKSPLPTATPVPRQGES